VFTGIIIDRQPVLHASFRDEGLDFDIDLGRAGSEAGLGDSIAVDGCCLTIESLDGTRARFHAGRETLGLTTLDRISAGREVNLEPALRLGDKIGGHLVSGHVDGVGEVASIRSEPSQTWMSFRLPERLREEVILKGSICLDGVSLTITELRDDTVSVALIPHTLAVTTLGQRAVGDRVNVETDGTSKWVKTLVEANLEARFEEFARSRLKTLIDQGIAERLGESPSTGEGS
jgi:riboflavin synthase